MKYPSLVVTVTVLALSAFAATVHAEDAKSAPAEVTLKGILMGSDRCWREGQPEDKPPVPILIALEGTGDVSAAFQDIFKDLMAGKSINYEQSKSIEGEMHKRLKYYVTTGDITDAIKKTTW